MNFRSQLPYDWNRGVKAILDLADELEQSGFHHLPAHAEEMKLALGKAHSAMSSNNVGGALTALGAFWDIFKGRLDEHPEYANRDAVKMAANLIPLQRIKTFLGQNGWFNTGRGPGTFETIVKGDLSLRLPRSHEYEPEACKAFIAAAIVSAANDLKISENEVKTYVSVLQ